MSALGPLYEAGYAKGFADGMNGAIRFLDAFAGLSAVTAGNTTASMMERGIAIAQEEACRTIARELQAMLAEFERRAAAVTEGEQS